MRQYTAEQMSYNEKLWAIAKPATCANASQYCHDKYVGIFRNDASPTGPNITKAPFTNGSSVANGKNRTDLEKLEVGVSARKMEANVQCGTNEVRAELKVVSKTWFIQT